MMQKEKKEVRKKVRARLKMLSNEQKHEQAKLVFDQIEKLQAFNEAQEIMHYWSLSDEIPTHEYIQKWSETKRILLPVIKGENLIIKEFKGIKNMRPDPQFSIPEPVGPAILRPKPDIIIIPGVAFDCYCNRLGRGKGFYDRFLLKHQLNAKLIGVCFNEQIVQQVPVETHDFKLDMVFTQKNRYQSTNYKSEV